MKKDSPEPANQNDQTFLNNDVFNQIKQKYLRDSVQYSQASSSSFGNENFIANFRASRNFGESQGAGTGNRLEVPLGMQSISQISQSVIQNKESRLGIIQQSLKSSDGGGILAYSSEGSQMLQAEEPARDVRSIIAKY